MSDKDEMKKEQEQKTTETNEKKSENQKKNDDKNVKSEQKNEKANAEQKGANNENEEKDDHIKLEDLSVDELRKFVMFQKSINDALTKENEQLIKEKQELGKVIANSDKYLDQLVALKSDFASYKERIRSDAERSRDEGRINAIEKILPLLDTLEKARVDVNDGKAFELIYRQLTKCLFEMGVEEIDLLNQTFDPNLANAITNREVADELKGKVVEVYQKGYKFKDRILRYAQVIVGK